MGLLWSLMQTPWFWLLIIMLIVNTPYVKGLLGELAVAVMLKFLNKDIYKVFHDLYITKEDGSTSQIDHVVTSPFGVFVIETKNYNGWIFGDEKSKYWTQVIYRTKNRFLNPIIQNKGHIKHLSNFLGVADKSKYISIISFSSRSTLKKVKTTTKVIYSIKLVWAIKRYKSVIIEAEELQSMNAKLMTLERADWKTRRDHVRYIKGKPVKPREKEMKTESEVEAEEATIHVCPRCGSNLVERNGKRGKFMGCSGFPKCRYTSDL